MNFIERCLAGNVKDPDAEIHDEIDIWHDTDLGFSDIDFPPLHEFLGMSREEYRFWVEQKLTVSDIIRLKRC
jgi:hypothetical protein